MRNVARLKMGYYPLPESGGVKLRALLSFAGPASVTFHYLRQFGPLLAERILETYPPLQSTKDPVAPRIATLLRKALPAQALAITGTAKYLRKAKAAANNRL
jgi:hypothetical protein